MLWQHVFRIVVCVLGAVQRATTRPPFHHLLVQEGYF